MYLIVRGAEPEGQRFLEIAIEHNPEVTLIEEDEEKAREVLRENKIRVLNGDIADEDILEEADIDRADAVVATTYDDSKNLMAMALAREYKVETRISLVNQPSHIKLFEKLGAEVVSDPAIMIARQLYQHLS
ncbi:MAG: NAD-binding protein [Phormidesmis sp.]